MISVGLGQIRKRDDDFADETGSVLHASSHGETDEEIEGQGAELEMDEFIVPNLPEIGVWHFENA